MLESRLRSITKSLTWRAIALVTTTTVTWKATGRLDLAASVGLIDTAIKLGLFYLHERGWSRVTFGRQQPEYEI